VRLFSALAFPRPCCYMLRALIHTGLIIQRIMIAISVTIYLSIYLNVIEACPSNGSSGRPSEGEVRTWLTPFLNFLNWWVACLPLLQPEWYGTAEQIQLHSSVGRPCWCSVRFPFLSSICCPSERFSSRLFKSLE
jgi:hypothetical protein